MKGTPLAAVPKLFCTRGLKCLGENLAIAKRVPQGRLNLAQDVVLGRD